MRLVLFPSRVSVMGKRMAMAPDYGPGFQAKRTMNRLPATTQYRPKGQRVRVLKYRVKNATDTKAPAKAHNAPTSA
jgi:hypothetical protein